MIIRTTAKSFACNGIRHEVRIFTPIQITCHCWFHLIYYFYSVFKMWGRNADKWTSAELAKSRLLRISKFAMFCILLIPSAVADIALNAIWIATFPFALINEFVR